MRLPSNRTVLRDLRNAGVELRRWQLQRRRSLAASPVQHEGVPDALHHRRTRGLYQPFRGCNGFSLLRRREPNLQQLMLLQCGVNVGNHTVRDAVLPDDHDRR